MGGGSGPPTSPPLCTSAHQRSRMGSCEAACRLPGLNLPLGRPAATQDVARLPRGATSESRPACTEAALRGVRGRHSVRIMPPVGASGSRLGSSRTAPERSALKQPVETGVPPPTACLGVQGDAVEREGVCRALRSARIVASSDGARLAVVADPTSIPLSAGASPISGGQASFFAGLATSSDRVSLATVALTEASAPAGTPPPQSTLTGLATGAHASWFARLSASSNGISKLTKASATEGRLLLRSMRPDPTTGTRALCFAGLATSPSGVSLATVTVTRPSVAGRSPLCPMGADHAVGCASAVGPVYLTLTYCTSDFTGKGAVLSVDPSTGKYAVVGHPFTWPQISSDGCPVQYDPNVFSSSNLSYLVFPDNFGQTIEVNVAAGTLSRAWNPKDPGFDIFDGFTTLAPLPSGALGGLIPYVTQDGWCSDGCFQWGTLPLPSAGPAIFSGGPAFPYKAVMTNVGYLDPVTNAFFAQASYPLAPSAGCSTDGTQQCLVAINATSGEVLYTKGPLPFTVYAWSPNTLEDGSLVAWVYGFESVCKDPYDDYAFAKVNLATGAASLIACIPKGIVVDTDPWIGAFSADGSVYVTGSGNMETGEVQLLAFDVANGALTLNTSLPGLKLTLGVSADMPFIDIWAAAF